MKILEVLQEGLAGDRVCECLVWVEVSTGNRCELG